MRKKFFKIILFLFFFINFVYAQSGYKVEFSEGKILSGLQNTLLPFWDTGFSLGITASKQLNKEIELTSSFNYQNFKFQPDRVGFPPTTFFYSPSRSVTGENSNVYNFSLGVRLLTSSNKISTFFSFSSGLQYINQGEIFITSSQTIFKGSTQVTTSNTNQYNSSNNNYLMGFAAIGVGLKFRINPKINLIMEGRMLSTFKDFTTYPNISTGIQYSF